MGSLELDELRRFDGACILSVSGEIDETTVAAFEYGLEAGCVGSRSLVVDLTGCSVSSDGIAALLDVHRRNRDQVPVTLVVRDPNLLWMFEVVGLRNKLSTCPSVDAALSSTSERASHDYWTNFGRIRRLKTTASDTNAFGQHVPPDEPKGLELRRQV